MDQCMTCRGAGTQERGWAGGASADGSTCFDCRGTGEDRTPYGTGSDHCPHCAADWKDDHDEQCPVPAADPR